MVKKATKLTIKSHILIPKHSICSDKEKEQMFKKYNSTQKEFPKILPDDAGLQKLNAKKGDLIKVERDDKLLGKVTFYRVVSNE